MGSIRFWLNDEPVDVSGVATNTTLLNFIRDERNLSGTKEGCAEGDCGACTVAVLEDPGTPQARYLAVNSCLMLVGMIHGKRVYTVEALHDGTRYHPVQTALAEAMGSQCGYCTPGIIMSMFEACYRDDLDAPWKIDDQLCGNLCRCTGYRPIRQAAQEVAGSRPTGPFLERLGAPADPIEELAYAAEGEKFFAPTSWEALERIVETEGASAVRFVSGATDLGLDVTKRHARYGCLVHLGHLPGMAEIHREGDRWSIGGGVPLSTLEALTEQDLPIMARMLRFFGARQIKNGATLGGNICNASPIGDTPPVLLALNASIEAHGPRGGRSIPIDEFFLDYRKTALEPGEVVRAVTLDTPPSDTLLGAYKVSKRRELDISAVCAAMSVRLDEDGRVAEARIAYGGMAATPARARQTETALLGQPWCESSVLDALPFLERDYTPMSDHRGSDWYRAKVARNLLLAFYEETRSAPYVHLPDRPAATVVLEDAR